MTGAAPSGVVTFLFTDVEGSTRRWENDANAMRAALAAHDEVLRKVIEALADPVISRRRSARRPGPSPLAGTSRETVPRQSLHSRRL
jgi:hypothetical protein